MSENPAPTTKLHRLLRAMVFVLVPLVLLALGFAIWLRLACDWHDGRGLPTTASCQAIAKPDFTVATFNAHRLGDANRTLNYFRALRDLNRVLANDGSLPDILSTQEIESEQALLAWRQSLATTHYAASCKCNDLPSRSGDHWVGLALSTAAFANFSEECIDLGNLFIDHQRCATVVRANRLRSNQPIVVVGVHGAWHWNNEANAHTLLRVLPREERAQTIVLGDLNSHQDWPTLKRWYDAGFADAEPNSGATHAIGWRLDHVLLGENFESVCSVPRLSAFQRVRPVNGGVECRDGVCSISDHLPVMVRVRARSEVDTADSRWPLEASLAAPAQANSR